MKHSRNILWAAALPLLLAACRDVPAYNMASTPGDTLRDNMISANRIIAQSEEQQIDAYTSRRGWHTTKLAGGARVMTTRSGTGSAIGYEDTVDVAYSIEDLSGRTLYERQSEQIVCGRMQPTRGLDAALRTLRRGSHAVVILPSEQAYGVVGDGNRIGSRMVLVYKIEIK